MDLKYFLKKPINIILKLDNMRIIRIPDKKYLEIVYKSKFHKNLNLDNPQTFNEKLQWLKLYDRKPEYTKMVDKYEVKKYVASIIGDEYIIPTLGIYDKFDDIDFDKLPNQFVMKCTHDSGGLIICNDKSKLNIKEARKKINKALKRKYFYLWREWPYKNVKPRIIIEKYMVDESGYELRDYKFFSFNGKVKLMFIATDRMAKTETCFDFYDEKFNHLSIKNGHPNSTKSIEKPKNFEKMIELSEKLSKDIPHVRVDFYNINGKIFFGEMTFSHWGGLVPFDPESYDSLLGSWIKLPNKKGV